MSILKRENVDRTQSERIIDKFLHKAKKDKNNQILEKELGLDKVKKIKLEQDKLEQLSKEPPKNVSNNEALDKLMTHVQNPLKCVKVLSMIYQLFHQNIKSINPLHVLDCLLQIVLNQEKIGIKNVDRLIPLRIFQIVERSNLMDFNQQRVFQLLSLQGIKQNSMYTDDSFQFNQQLKYFTHYMNKEYEKTLPDYFNNYSSDEIQEKNYLESNQDKLIKDKQAETTEEIQQFYEYEASNLLNQLLNSHDDRKKFKQEIFVNVLRDLHIFYSKYEWSRSPINIILSEIQDKSQILNDEQMDIVLKSKALIIQHKIQDQNKSLKRQNLDNLIMSNPLNPQQKVVDGRETQLITQVGSDKWASKQ